MTEIKFCKTFYCDERGDRYCCRTCWYLPNCPNPCLNHPDRCKLVDTSKTEYIKEENPC